MHAHKIRSVFSNHEELLICFYLNLFNLITKAELRRQFFFPSFVFSFKSCFQLSDSQTIHIYIYMEAQIYFMFDEIQNVSNSMIFD
jgi:hypothetical protein